MFRQKKYNTHAFTLLEITIVITILGVLTALAIPKFNGVIEKNRSKEAVQILLALLNSQKAYFIDNQAYTRNIALLDIAIPRSQNFNAPSVYNNINNVASITRRINTYTLSINASGVIACTPAPAGSANCRQIGY